MSIHHYMIVLIKNDDSCYLLSALHPCASTLTHQPEVFTLHDQDGSSWLMAGL
jgi:hypothetical protein